MFGNEIHSWKMATEICILTANVNQLSVPCPEYNASISKLRRGGVLSALVVSHQVDAATRT